MNRYMDLPETVSLINQERSNNKLYVSLLEATPDGLLRRQDHAQPAGVGAERHAGRAARPAAPWSPSPESASEQASVPFDYVDQRQLFAEDHGEVAEHKRHPIMKKVNYRLGLSRHARRCGHGPDKRALG